MGEQFNIKDAETVRLARDMAKELGKSVTATVREALEEKAERRIADRAERIEAINRIVADIRSNMPPDVRALSSKEWMDSIYGGDGLPEE